MIHKAQKILKTVFGYDKFISLQADIIENVLSKNDTLVIMPTGGGKSLCYQIPALIFKGITVVVSPLISLMKDQVEQLSETGVSAVLLNSSLPLPQYRRNVELVKEKKIKLLYIAPESLLKPGILEMLSSVQIDCLAIDEAHCISAWGHDFRPEYRQLTEFRRRFPDAVCVALTATATTRVRSDIKTSLGFKASNEYVASFNRENLFIQIIPKNNAVDQTIRFIKKYPDQSGIIYCFTRRQVDDLYAVLDGEGFSVRPYHAGLSDMERKQNQEMFIKDDVQIIVATIAFGMGINKLNVRFVIHFDMPKNIESYYQEIGRAGRDGLYSHCVMFFSYGDVYKIKHFINSKNDSEKRVAGIQFNAFLRFAETDDCRRIPLLGYFGEEYLLENCNMCDNCLDHDRELTDITIYAQKFLSCVKRTGEIFGMAHIIDVLRGSTAKKVLKFRHDKLSTYGIGKDLSKKEWMGLARQFVHKRYLDQDMEYGSLKLTGSAWEVLRGKEEVMGRLIKVDEDKQMTQKGTDLTIRPEYEKDLFEILRKKRKELADGANVPPYVVFPDKTLVEMASFFPRNMESLLDIHGVGIVKSEKYGSNFIGLIKEYCEQHQIKEKPSETKKLTSKNINRYNKLRHVVVGEAFNAGKSIGDIMEDLNIKQDTVLNHLLKYLQEGCKLRYDDELLNLAKISKDQKQHVLETFEKIGPEFLKPVFDALDGTVGYEDLKIIRLYFLSKNNLTLKCSGKDHESFVDHYKHIVCLANSRKYSGRCVAGKEFVKDMIGNWIRPVSRQKTGELLEKSIIMQNGKMPELLDIIKISVKEQCPESYQTENYFFDENQWIKVGDFPVSKLSDLCDHVEDLWINGYHSHLGINDRIPTELADKTLTSSLLLIRPDTFSIIVDEGSKALKKVRGKFSYKNKNYSLTVTDPVIENRYLDKKTDEYVLTEKEIYLTVSIGEPFEGFCYKLIAAVIEPEL